MKCTDCTSYTTAMHTTVYQQTYASENRNSCWANG